MEIEPLLELVAITGGVAGLLLAITLLAGWRSGRRERWMAALAPLALAGGFVAGYARFLEFPSGLADEPWKMAVVIALLAGILLAVARGLPAGVAWRLLEAALLATLLAGATWLTARRFGDERWDYGELLGVGLLVYLAIGRAVAGGGGPWAGGLLAMMISGFAATFVTLAWIDAGTLGQMLIMLTALSGLSLAVGIFSPLRAAAAGATGFLAVMFAVLLAFVSRYRSAEIPWWIFPWLAAGPLAMALAWIPGLRRRPWLCTAAVGILTVLIVVPAVLMAKKYAPEFEM